MKKNPNADFSANKMTVQVIVNELNSGFGTAMTGSAPYKSVDSITLRSSSYHERREQAYGKIVIESENGSHHGDKWQTKKSFYISQADAAELARVAPEKFRKDFADIVSTFKVLAEKYDVKRAEEKRAEQQRLFRETAKNFTEGTGSQIDAPERATFRKPPRRGP